MLARFYSSNLDLSHSTGFSTQSDFSLEEIHLLWNSTKPWIKKKASSFLVCYKNVKFLFFKEEKRLKTYKYFTAPKASPALKEKKKGFPVAIATSGSHQNSA